jgi:GTP pyrophosphokinase
MYSERLTQAFEFASRLHAEQKKKGTEVPYLAHLMGVTSIVVEQGGDEDEVIAALLHDAVEDQGGLETLREIEERFGTRVGGIVRGCSDSTTVPKPPWGERKGAYLAHLEEAGPSERLVSAADKLYNVNAIITDYQSVGEELWKRFAGGREGVLWYYRSLAEKFGRLGPVPLATKLREAVEKLNRMVAEPRPDPNP